MKFGILQVLYKNIMAKLMMEGFLQEEILNIGKSWSYEGHTKFDPNMSMNKQYLTF